MQQQLKTKRKERAMQQNRRFIDVEAPSVEEAVRKGIKELNTSIEKIDIEILDEPKKGGLFKRQSNIAKVRLTVMGEYAVEPAAPATVKEPEKPRMPEAPRREAEPAPVKPAPANQMQKRERQERPQPVKNAKPAEVKEEIIQNSEAQKKILESFRNITNMMGFELNPDIIELKNKFRIIVKDAKHANLLIGKNGKTLEALQHIMNKMFAGNDAKPIYLDIKGYVKQKRKNRMERHWKKEAQ